MKERREERDMRRKMNERRDMRRSKVKERKEEI